MPPMVIVSMLAILPAMIRPLESRNGRVKTHPARPKPSSKHIAYRHAREDKVAERFTVGLGLQDYWLECFLREFTQPKDIAQRASLVI